MRLAWFALGATSLALGAVGLVLPLVPTVPFLLLAAFCFARSSERMHRWLITHPTLGPPIVNWQRNGAIGRRAKKLATLSIAVGLLISVALGVRQIVLAIQAAVLLAVLVFIWTRPEGSR